MQYIPVDVLDEEHLDVGVRRPGAHGQGNIGVWPRHGYQPGRRLHVAWGLGSAGAGEGLEEEDQATAEEPRRGERRPSGVGVAWCGAARWHGAPDCSRRRGGAGLGGVATRSGVGRN